MPANPGQFVALIPARGGSKRLPRKNLLSLCGKPLISYSIEAAQGCEFVSRVCVSTEDREIADVARSLGAMVIERPRELATDSATSRSVVLHAIDTLARQGENFECFALLQPTSPLRTGAHLSDCINSFLGGTFGCAISVCESEQHPAKMLALDGDGTLVPLGHASELEKPHQSLPVIYRQNGAIYLMRCSDFRDRADGFYLKPAMPFAMSVESSVDIDSELDFRVAELLLEQRK